jgi:intracellular multiplication protein IcmQ
MDEETKYNLELIRELDELISNGKWEGGLFFLAAGKKLRALSETLKAELQLSPEQQPTSTEVIDFVKQKSGLLEIYISVYCAEGRNLQKWEIVLASLPRQIVGRPVYKREKDIRETINTKENPVNDAYAIAYVTEMDILKPSFRDKALVDRFGHELIRLKDNSLKIENITRLVHLSNNYAYRKGILTKL